MNQATTKSGGEATCNDTPRGNPELKALNPEEKQKSNIKSQNDKL